MILPIFNSWLWLLFFSFSFFFKEHFRLVFVILTVSIRVFWFYLNAFTHTCIHNHSIKGCVGESIGVNKKWIGSWTLRITSTISFYMGVNIKCCYLYLKSYIWLVGIFFLSVLCSVGFLCGAFFVLNHTHHRYEIYIQIQSYGRPWTLFHFGTRRSYSLCIKSKGG